MDPETDCGCDHGMCCGFCDCCPCPNHIEEPGKLCPTCHF